MYDVSVLISSGADPRGRPPYFRKGKEFLKYLSLTKQDSDWLRIQSNFERRVAESFRSLRRYINIIITLLPSNPTL